MIKSKADNFLVENTKLVDIISLWGVFKVIIRGDPISQKINRAKKRNKERQELMDQIKYIEDHKQNPTSRANMHLWTLLQINE